MSDQLTESAERLFSTHVDKDVLRAAERSDWPNALWDAVSAAGYPAALLSEEAGGFGATPAEAFGLIQVAASHAAPIPLAEAMLAGHLLDRAGLVVPPGVMTLAPVRRTDALHLAREGGGWRLSGTARRVPWARQATTIVAVAEGPDGPMVAAIPAAGLTIMQGTNIAGEPRDAVTFDSLVAEAAPCPISARAVRGAGAALRTAQMAGALTKVLSICIEYVQTRVQFGRPIGKFQAIQQNMAVLAGQAAAAGAAADMAALAFDSLDLLVIAAAKARAGEAASIAASLAHQAHGAIGFTQEYQLHHLTRRLWSWRDEFGNEAEWNEVVGRAALLAGGDGLWSAITAA